MAQVMYSMQSMKCKKKRKKKEVDDPISTYYIRGDTEIDVFLRLADEIRQMQDENSRLHGENYDLREKLSKKNRRIKGKAKRK